MSETYLNEFQSRKFTLDEINGRWLFSCDGQVVSVCVSRSSAIAVAASKLSTDIRYDRIDNYEFIGFSLDELRESHARNINWKRKGPPIDLTRFCDAELYLDSLEELEVVDKAYAQYRRAMAVNDFSGALDQLILIGNELRCSAQYWQILIDIAGFTWSHVGIIPDRKRRGEVETKIEFVSRRAAGDWGWSPKLRIDGYNAT